MIEAGRHFPLGASWDGDGVNFALYSAAADSVDLCFFDVHDKQFRRSALTARTGDIWHGYVPGCGPGQAYGYRVHGRYAPEAGLRQNASKLLIDPYARALRGEFVWSPAVFDFELEAKTKKMHYNDADSADFVPKCVVVGSANEQSRTSLRIPWTDMVVYEVNVRGYTMRNLDIPESDRGFFRGMQNGHILEYLKSLGITSVELMPVQSFIDEHFLHRRELRNFWGYNTINFFAPAQRYLGGDDIVAFREMVDSIHEAGFEVILDVVYNHTGESDRYGPTLSFRGIDNLCYYRTIPDKPGDYLNDTGCGNTINVDHPVVRRLIIDSLRYWAGEMGIDGFRFDLATVLGRGEHGYHHEHQMFNEIEADALLQNVKLIAEPWDPGPGGYQLGAFPPAWAEWNDRYRDAVRRFWRGDEDQEGEFAQRLGGSIDIFGPTGRLLPASVNFVTSHDGFTLSDVVSYETRHNEDNGEDNRDGHQQNFSHNHGVEGDTADPDINALRRRQRLNMLATLILSQGTPMLLAGDEFGNSQRGNNNAYAQDNDIGWLDWSGIDTDPDFIDAVRDLLRIRRESPLFRQSTQLDNWIFRGDNCCAVVWYSGSDLLPDSATAVFANAANASVELELPDHLRRIEWQVAFTTGEYSPRLLASHSWQVAGRSISCLRPRYAD